MRRGELSAEQAGAIADAAAVNPGAENDLLDLARRDSLRRLRDEAARRKAQADTDPDAKQRRIHRKRSLRTWVGPDGAWHLHATGTIADGATIGAEMERWADRRFRRARHTSQREPRDAYAFDGLADLARSHTGTATGAGTAGGDGERGDGPSRYSRTDPKHLALIHIDLTALVRGHVAGDERCEIPGLGPISIQQARNLLGDSILKLVITKGDDVARIVHLGRGPNAAQTIALLWSNPMCIAQGCNQPAQEYDHRNPYATVKQTELFNLDGYCRSDHANKTRHNHQLIEGTGRRPFVPPNDPRHPEHPEHHGHPDRAGP